MHAYVLAELENGDKIDGIITGLDDEYVYLAVPVNGEHDMESMSMGESRIFGYPGYGYGPGFGYGGFYGGYPPRRFRRLVLPLAGLAALTLLPWY